MLNDAHFTYLAIKDRTQTFFWNERDIRFWLLSGYKIYRIRYEITEKNYDEYMKLVEENNAKH